MAERALQECHKGRPGCKYVLFCIAEKALWACDRKTARVFTDISKARKRFSGHSHLCFAILFCQGILPSAPLHTPYPRRWHTPRNSTAMSSGKHGQPYGPGRKRRIKGQGKASRAGNTRSEQPAKHAHQTAPSTGKSLFGGYKQKNTTFYRKIFWRTIFLLYICTQ